RALYPARGSTPAIEQGMSEIPEPGDRRGMAVYVSDIAEQPGKSDSGTLKALVIAGVAVLGVVILIGAVVFIGKTSQGKPWGPSPRAEELDPKTRDPSLRGAYTIQLTLLAEMGMIEARIDDAALTDASLEEWVDTGYV